MYIAHTNKKGKKEYIFSMVFLKSSSNGAWGSCGRAEEWAADEQGRLRSHAGLTRDKLWGKSHAVRCSGRGAKGVLGRGCGTERGGCTQPSSPEPHASVSSCDSETRSEPPWQKERMWLETAMANSFSNHGGSVRKNISDDDDEATEDLCPTWVSDRLRLCAVWTLSLASRYLCLLKIFSNFSICLGVNLVLILRWAPPSLSPSLPSSMEEAAASLS